jgi:hypothetical protein
VECHVHITVISCNDVYVPFVLQLSKRFEINGLRIEKFSRLRSREAEAAQIRPLVSAPKEP